jgi:pyruvate,water dikinase
MTQLAPLETGAGPVILVVPYTDAGWALLLAGVQGLIAEVGGRLSHGAIIAREYGIPAVMDVTDATQRLHDGQWVRLNGEQGWVEVLDRSVATYPGAVVAVDRLPGDARTGDQDKMKTTEI